MKVSRLLLVAWFIVIAALCMRAANTEKDDDAYAPHTPTLLFRVTGLAGQTEADAIVASVQKLKSVRKAKVDLAQDWVQVRFDSHVVSYHQVAQAIADAGDRIGKKYDPRLKFTVADYAKGNNAAKVDAIFAGKRLNTRVKVELFDKAKGEFIVHFLPLKIDPTDPDRQGFDGGHLHHPISDPVPRGLGLPSSYAAEYTPPPF
ncbi:MAG TPA: hypothetical protein VNW23_04570 [Opitutaceae bacterium]|nr:hypothetical protein [Opitutaceae bacterium]